MIFNFFTKKAGTPLTSRLYGVWHYRDNRDDKEAHAIEHSCIHSSLSFSRQTFRGKNIAKTLFSIYSKELINIYLFIGKCILLILLMQIYEYNFKNKRLIF